MSKQKKLYYIKKYVGDKNTLVHGPFPNKDAIDLMGALQITAKEGWTYEMVEANESTKN